MTRALAVLAAVLLAGSCERSDPFAPSPVETLSLFYASQVAPGGFSWRSFTVPRSGEVKVFLTQVVPVPPQPLVLGVGPFDGTNCTITTSVAREAGGADPVLTTTLTAGNYCLRLADPGVLTRMVDFSITIVVPAPATSGS